MMNFLKRLWNDVNGEIDASDVIMASIALFLCAVLLPIGISQIYAANTTGWNAAVKTIFQVLLPVLSIVGVAVYFIVKLKG